MSIIIGIDPGSRITGYGVIAADDPRHPRYIASGCIRVNVLNDTASRLKQIFQGLQSIIQTYQPQAMAIEQVFMHQNPNSALKLGQARGVAMVAGALNMDEIAEYSARQIKQFVVGYGAASKNQVQHMVQRLLGLSGLPQADAADALAVALCHAHLRQVKII